MIKAGLQQQRAAVAGDGEQPGMAERYQAGITDQHVEREREHREQQDLARDIDVVGIAHPQGRVMSKASATAIAPYRNLALMRRSGRTGLAAAAPGPRAWAGTGSRRRDRETSPAQSYKESR